MRKKFLSALMLGLLTLGTTSTITSCKDYDGDISSLKDQIKSLEDLVAQKEATINSSISNLQSAIDKANNEHATKAALEEAKDILAAAIENESSDRVKADAELSAAIAKAQAAADAAAKVAATNTESIQKVANDLANAVTQLNTLSDGLKEANQNIGLLNTALVAQKAELDSVMKAGDAATLKAAYDSIASLKTQLEAADKELKQALADEAAKVSGQIDAVNTNLSILKTAHEEVAANVSTLLNTTIPNIENEINAVSKKIDAVDAKYDVITKMLAKDLRSLVFIPNLYVDGIETVEYPFITDTTLVLSNEIILSRQRGTGVPEAPETYKKQLKNIFDYVHSDAKSEAWTFGPTWPVQYHGNPGSNSTAFTDLKQWLCREVEVVTRAKASDLNIAAPQEKYDNGDMLFSNTDGIITAGLKINNPKYLLDNGPKAYADGETGDKSYGMDNIIALQAKTKNGVEDSTVTSDYAMLYPERVHPEGIVWVQANDRGALGTVDQNKGNNGTLTCSVADSKIYHIWDNPTDALIHDKGLDTSVKTTSPLADTDYGCPDIALAWNGTGIVLSEYIGTHVQKFCDIKTHTKNCITWTNYKEVEKWGLKYIFETVDYTVDQNITSDSRYISCDKYTGKIIAGGVDAAGNHVATQAESSVGREPLVRVRLVDAATETKTFLDAYILIRIVKDAKQKDDVEVTSYPELNHEFSLCDAFLGAKTTWSQFDQYVLDDKLDGMDKTVFDAQYKPDLESSYNYNTTGVNGAIYRMKVYVKDANGKYIESKYKDAANHEVAFGSILYYEDQNQTTNHAFQVALSEDELEYLTHDNASGKFECYARYNGQIGSKYSHIYIKFVVNLTRKAYETGIKTKNNNYWFDLDGTDVAYTNANYDAIALNVGEPASNNQIKCTTWSSDEMNVFVNNTPMFTVAGYNAGNYLTADQDFRKFYFAPIDVTITDQHGKTWTITAKSSSTDEWWNAFVCHNNICCNETHDKFNATLTAYNTGLGHFTNTLSGLTSYRPDYQGDINLHGNDVYKTHKFQTTTKVVNVVVNEDGKNVTKQLTVNVSNDQANAEILDKCAIDYNDGCFTNDKLYAFDGTTYTAIATMNQATGEIKLIESEAAYTLPLDMILNAIGYSNDVHGNISAEMRTWVGLVVNNGCDVAVNPFKVNGERNANSSIWEASWQRPVNLLTKAPREIYDAQNDGEFISLQDLLSFYDWRGPVKGNMEGANKWLWGYYNIKGIKFDLTPSKVLTNMHQSDSTSFVKLSEVSTKVKLYAASAYNSVNKSFTIVPGNYVFSGSFDYRPYAGVNRNAAMLNAFQNDRAKYGWIYYTNNGDNVTRFKVKVPVEVEYQWGHFDTYIEVTINRSLGN